VGIGLPFARRELNISAQQSAITVFKSATAACLLLATANKTSKQFADHHTWGICKSNYLTNVLENGGGSGAPK